ncbi:MAG: NAD(P)-dependent oxidoreductase [Bacteroidia bacterium]|nr:NAD(P)-dependent oxidoreductase [Bacteroidia bacterium]NNJ55526.1 NAD(P)-dependent oxidoreductase [Bacteroidia bacterium]
MAKIIVTGGSGFLGSHIADALSDQGHDVIIIDLEESIYLRSDQKFLKGDIRDQDFLDNVLSGIDYVYHLAGLADLNLAKEMPIESIDINIRGTAVLLNAAVKNKVSRVIFGSSVYVFSKQGGFYRCSKQACEAYLEEYHRKYNLNYTVLRYGSLYGPRTDESNGVYRLLKNFIAKEQLEHDGEPSDKREYIHVYDAAKLSAQILDKSYENKHYVLTGNDKLEVSELYKMFEEILNKKVDIHYLNSTNGKNGHYNITPYTYLPSIGKKLVTNEYVDMGQGIIQLLEEMRLRNEE